MTNVLILGATSDVAQALAYKFASAKCNIMLAARNAARLTAVTSDLQIRHGIDAQAVEFDALQFDSHAEFYARLPARPDIAICVFGYLGSQPTAQSDFAETQKIINTNYTGAVSILNVIANDFETRRGGTIIGISSVAGDRGRQSNYVYGSAKAGLTAYLSGLRNRLVKSNVQVVTVKPGFIRTKMTAGMPLPGLVTAEPGQVADDVFDAYRKGNNQIYTLWMWRFIMLIIRHIPESLFKRLKL